MPDSPDPAARGEDRASSLRPEGWLASLVEALARLQREHAGALAALGESFGDPWTWPVATLSAAALVPHRAVREYLVLTEMLACARGPAVRVTGPMRGLLAATRAAHHMARLAGADLRGVDLQRARLPDARLGGARLERARLERADLRGATYSESGEVTQATRWPSGFDPRAAGARLVMP